MDQRLGNDELASTRRWATTTRRTPRRPAAALARPWPPTSGWATSSSRQLFREKLAEFAKTLEDKERFIFEKRLIADEPLTLQDIGDQYGVSRERARQIEAGADRPHARVHARADPRLRPGGRAPRARAPGAALRPLQAASREGGECSGARTVYRPRMSARPLSRRTPAPRRRRARGAARLAPRARVRGREPLHPRGGAARRRAGTRASPACGGSPGSCSGAPRWRWSRTRAPSALRSPKLFEYPFLYFGGDGGFPPLSDAEVENLRRYLTFGGFMLADANDGSERRRLRRLVPPRAGARAARRARSPALPGDHVVFKSFFLLDAAPGRLLIKPQLEAVTRGQARRGRLLAERPGRRLEPRRGRRLGVRRDPRRRAAARGGLPPRRQPAACTRSASTTRTTRCTCHSIMTAAGAAPMNTSVLQRLAAGEPLAPADLGAGAARARRWCWAWCSRPGGAAPGARPRAPALAVALARRGRGCAALLLPARARGAPAAGGAGEEPAWRCWSTAPRSMGFPAEPGGQTRAQAAAGAAAARGARAGRRCRTATPSRSTASTPSCSRSSADAPAREPPRGGTHGPARARCARWPRARRAPRRRSSRAVVLLSDGADNAELAQRRSAAAPAAALEDLGVPVSTVAVGAARRCKDLAVERGEGRRLRLRAQLARRRGRRPRRAASPARTCPVVLDARGPGGGEQDGAARAADDATMPVSFTFTPDQTGRFVYTVAVPGLPGRGGDREQQPLLRR